MTVKANVSSIRKSCGPVSIVFPTTSTTKVIPTKTIPETEMISSAFPKNFPA